MRTPVVALAAALLLVACTPSGPGPSTPRPSTPVVTHSPSPTPTNPSPSPSPTVRPSYPTDLPTEDPVSAAIIKGWQRYLEVYDKFAADPLTPTDWTETQLVTEGEERRGILDALQQLREERLMYKGGMVYRDVEVGAPVEGPDGTQTAVLTYCVDASRVVVVYADTGKPFERVGPSVLRETTTLVKAHDGTWRVSLIRNQEAKC
ncbi:MAG: hypothetical protein QM713_15900 [Arachnia sp.]